MEWVEVLGGVVQIGFSFGVAGYCLVVLNKTIQQMTETINELKLTMQEMKDEIRALKDYHNND